MQNRLVYGIPVVVLFATALLYWPVVHASFVLDNVIDFVDMKWLGYGNDWKHYVLRDFNYCTNYFRPQVLALYPLQARLFSDTPGPMHVASLAMYLLNALLVGLLAWRCSATSPSTKEPFYLLPPCFSMGFIPYWSSLLHG